MKISDARLYGDYLVFELNWGGAADATRLPRRKLLLRALLDGTLAG